MNVVVVESPAKAKTINKYLGDDFTVLASYGHVRDLPSKDGSVRPEEDFAMTYEIDPKSAKHVREIAEAVKGADTLYLATDPDREGEAISWHVLEALNARRVLKGVDVKRVVFNEITKRAVQEGIAHPRDIDMDLVNAQQARRALDYLVGFTLSPVLWRKLPGSRSAGRVQSVALRLICERELEIEAFRPREYWSIGSEFQTEDGAALSTRLTRFEGKRVEKFTFETGDAADAATKVLQGRHYRIAEVTTKPVQRSPQPPFTTSTLQQEASRKLGFGAKMTMNIAQRLYEGIDIGGETAGLITYMRTDGVTLAQEAIDAARGVIRSEFGAEFVPEKPRAYKTKAKNAQEAHEAIRPTDMRRLPENLRGVLSDEQYKLYKLIWQRAVASQMANARLERTTVDITSDDDRHAFRVTGSVIRFPGFLKLYEEGQDDAKTEDENGRQLPPVQADTPVSLRKLMPEQHFTEPPPRYSEASLVKTLEELGIGRPSTYASIISVLQDRNYVRLEKKRFVPEDRGQLVTAFLSAFFSKYVEYNFTAELENKLDEISASLIDWKVVLRDFWEDFAKAVEATSNLKISEVLEAIDRILGPHIFPDPGDGSDPRACPSCKEGKLSLKLGKFGAFIGCSNYPDCRYTRQLDAPAEGEELAGDGPVILGQDPETGKDVSLRKGPYGYYVQLGEAEGKEKPKRVSLPKGMPPETVTFDYALRLLSLPRVIGVHPETGKPITAGLGRYGPYVESERKFVSLPSLDDAFEIGLNRAVALLAEAKNKGRKGAEPLRILGEHPDGGEITVMDGRYGPYVKYGRINATLPKDISPEEVTLEQAVRLIEERAAKTGRKKPAAKKRATAKKKPAAKKKTAAKKAAGKTA